MVSDLFNGWHLINEWTNRCSSTELYGWVGLGAEVVLEV